MKKLFISIIFAGAVASALIMTFPARSQTLPTIKMFDKEYEIPYNLSEMEDDGWTLTPRSKAEMEKQGNTICSELTKNNVAVLVDMTNVDGVEKVVAVQYGWEETGEDVTMDGIKIGDTEDSVVSMLENNNIKYEKVNMDCLTNYHYDGKTVTIDTRTGIVYAIRAESDIYDPVITEETIEEVTEGLIMSQPAFNTNSTGGAE